MQQLLGPLLSHLPAAHAAYLTGREFFPNLITGPFHDGLGVAFGFAILACVVGAVASALTGRAKARRGARRSRWRRAGGGGGRGHVRAQRAGHPRHGGGHVREGGQAGHIWLTLHSAGGVPPRGTSGAAQARCRMRVRRARAVSAGRPRRARAGQRHLSAYSRPGHRCRDGRYPADEDAGLRLGSSGRRLSPLPRACTGTMHLPSTGARLPRARWGGGSRRKMAPVDVRRNTRGDALLVSETSPAAVVILAAGEGTRMKSRTPKVLHALCGRSPARPRDRGGGRP